MPTTRASATVPSATSARGRTRSTPAVATRAKTQGSREAAERRFIADLQLENAQCKEQINELEDELEAMEDTNKELEDARKSLTQAAVERKEVKDTWKKQVQALEKRHKVKTIALKKQLQTQRASIETLTTYIGVVRRQLADEKGRVVDLERQLRDEKPTSRSWKDHFERLSAQSATAEQEEKAGAPESISTAQQQGFLTRRVVVPWSQGPSRVLPSAAASPVADPVMVRRITRPRPTFSNEAPAGQRPRLLSPARPPPAPQAQAVTPITMQEGTPTFLQPLAPGSTHGNVPVQMTMAPMDVPVADEAMDEIWRTTLQDEMHARVQQGAGVDLIANWCRVAPAYIALLPSHSVPESSNLRGFECSICLEAYNVGENVLTLPCAHLVHTTCGSEWLSRNNACPSCTTPIVSQMPSASTRS